VRLELSRLIESDLEAIADWIAEDNPSRAVTFIQEIREAFRRIADNPLRYQLRPDIGDDARVTVVGNYVILFHIVGALVRIERVVYGGRDLPPIFQ